MTFALLSGCALLQGAVGAAEKPTLTFMRAAVVDVSVEGATINLVYQLDNPYPVALPLSDAAYRLDLEGKPLVSGEMPHGVRAMPHDKTEVIFPAHVAFADLSPALGAVVGKRTAHYRAEGHVSVETPAGIVTLPFSNEGDIDLHPSLSPLNAALPGTH
jgi:LEA14-like dessication related protein